MARLLAIVAIILALLVMVRGQQQQFILQPMGPMPATLIP
jgi:hypothetical protein